MFDFKIIDMPDGNQVIDRTRKTCYDELTPSQMIEYIETDKQMAVMDGIRKKKQRENQRKRKRNPLQRIAGLCGLVRG